MQKSLRIVPLIAISLLVYGASCDRTQIEEPRIAKIGETTLYLAMNQDDRLQIEHSGDGNRKSYSLMGKSVEFIADQLPENAAYQFGDESDDPKYHVVELTGEFVIAGEDQFEFAGTLRSKNRVMISFQGMKLDSKPDIENPEFAFEPGKHSFQYSGKITGWLE